ncbi:hypothetical protein K1719_008519 [Acacia pycnantha]|nr:hypothetical protein K1719_008519 [Acacia pycnantha]
MGKNQKSDLGRALVRQHNQMLQQSKEKSRLYRNQQKKILESVTEVTDIDAIIEQADEAERLFVSNQSSPDLPIRLDISSSTSEMTPEERRDLQKREEALHAGSLRVPRRPPWSVNMSVDELDANERQAFLTWRRSLARLEENEKLVLTPFEKNLDIWRQLWRVVERSDLLVMVVDSRDPLFYRCPDLEAYAREVDEHKRTLLLVNKADLLPTPIREKWAEYFWAHDIFFIFWSAKAATAALEGKKLPSSSDAENLNLKKSCNPDITIYSRDELLARLQSEAEEIVERRRKSSSSDTGPSDIQSRSENTSCTSSSSNVVVGFVGYPNVGKSSTINALVGQKRTGVTSTPGKTKHFQTLIISDRLTLCDCPGLVFPSFTSSRYEMIACGVLPIDRITEHREAVQVVADNVPRHVIEEVYRITLPRPKPYEPQSRPPLAAELLRTYCASRGYVASSGLPDETRAARQILKDYVDGKLPHYEMPPGMSNEEQAVAQPGGLDSVNLNKSDSSHIENSSDVESEDAPKLGHLLSRSLMLLTNIIRTLRKKDHSWRVGNDDDDDGMPVARFFQKPVNTGPMNV